MSSDKREFWWKEVSFDETNNIQLLQWLCNSLKLFLVRLISLYIIVFNGSNVKVKFSCKGYQSTSSWANAMKVLHLRTNLKHISNLKKWFSLDFILFQFKGSKHLCRERHFTRWSFVIVQNPQPFLKQTYKCEIDCKYTVITGLS